MFRHHKSLLQTLLTPILFELCGIIPLILVLFGLISVSAGVALRNILVGQYSFIFYILAAVFFSYSIYSYLKGKKQCNITGVIKNQKLIILVFVVLTLLEGLILIALQLIEKNIYGQAQTKFSDFLGVAASWWIVFILFLLTINLKGKNIRRQKS